MKLPHSASSPAAPPEMAPSTDSSQSPRYQRFYLWGCFASFLLVGLICVGFALRPTEEALDDREAFSSLDSSSDIFLENSQQTPPAPGIWGVVQESSTAPDDRGLLPQPELPVWTDVATVMATASYEEATTTAPPANWTTSHYVTTSASELDATGLGPVWLDGTIELTIDADTAPASWDRSDRTVRLPESHPATTYR